MGLKKYIVTTTINAPTLATQMRNWIVSTFLQIFKKQLRKIYQIQLDGRVFKEEILDFFMHIIREQTLLPQLMMIIFLMMIGEKIF